MRIQHNIMAMNAYRNYNNNNKALSGNLEKLSSGYKINRAGDDAAGLAISEKMRAQITGLNAASKNVKDGISLVKTAEGAMQEIQDMLNRMDYLATQSANGTYQDEVDREALQKEVNQLNEEINRIAESANFNGIKLLDGTWDADAKVRAVNTAQKAVDAAQKALDGLGEATVVDPVYGDEMNAAAIKGIMLPQVANGGAGQATDVGTKTVLETEKVEYQTPSFQVNLNGTSYTMATDGTATAAAKQNGLDSTADGLKLTVGTNNAFVLTEKDMKDYLTDKGVKAADIKAGYTLDSKDLAAAIAYKIGNDTTTNGVGNTNAASQLEAGASAKGLFNDGDNVWNVRADGDSLAFEFSENNKTPTTSLNKYFDTSVELAGTITKADVKATAGTFTATLTPGTVAGGTTDDKGDNTYSVTAKIGDETLTFNVENQKVNASAADLATAFANATAKNAAGEDVKLGDYFTVSAATNDVVFTDKTKGADGSGNTVTGLAFTKGATTVIDAADTTPGFGAVAAVAGADAYKAGLNGYINAGTEVVIAGVPSESDQLASTTLNFSGLDIVDGMKIRLGDEEYTFAVGADSKYKDGENVVDLTDLKAEELKKVAAGSTGVQATRDLALSRLTEAAKDNKTFTVSHEANGTPVDQIGIKQKAEVKETTDMTTMDKFASYIGISTVDDAKTQEAQDKADAEHQEKVDAAQAQLNEAQKGLATAEGVEGGKPLNLQIGDTSDTFNQLGVKIGSMKTTALGVDGLSVATSDDAAKAIDTIKNAINYVSSVRGDLGAYQNRLDHTANNLSVMAENIQDAESSIRDTDVAEEMMSYVKNNILVQSAQAMLAQANQVPQGVLQLLG